jgi:hypothetical protein
MTLALRKEEITSCLEVTEKMDKFPEAFNRFEQAVDVDRIATFKQLELAFGQWSGHKWGPTTKQLAALAVEARRLGIRPSKERAVAGERETVRVRAEYIKRDGKIIKIYRDTKTGHFVKKPNG